MDEDDYRALIAVLEAELREVGADDIADERHYTAVDREAGEVRLLDPRRRLIEMLEAFGRRLAVEDRATYDLSLQRMAERLRGDGPRGAFVIPTADDWEARPVDLGTAPELGELRLVLAGLIGRIRDTEGGPDRWRPVDG